MYKDYYWLNSHSRAFLSGGYLKKDVTPEGRIRKIAENAERILNEMRSDATEGRCQDFDGFADEFESYVKQGLYSMSTPTQVSFGEEDGLPVACFGSYISDDTAKIFDKVSEVAIMSKQGGGTSAYFGDLRGRGAAFGMGGGRTDGPVRFMELFDKTADVISQGAARRGSFAAYLSVEHPDIEEFLHIRGEGHAIQNMSIGVTISDDWMEKMISGDKEKRRIWGKIIAKKFESGYPYLFFSDTVNNAAPQVYKDKGLKIHAGNLCNEICLSNSETESFVCVLSSLNLLHWDKIKDNPRIIEVLVYFLEAVNEEFVRKTEGMKHMLAPHLFARDQRALGMGALGWHSYLQSKMIPFESLDAKMLNSEIWATIRKHADIATADLAKKLGEPSLLKGYGRRNVTTLAVAPTTSSSFILGQVSPSIEPENSCYYVKKLAKGSFTYKNPYLKKILLEKGFDNEETWKSILLKGGSVQNLTCLNEHEKAVFKTFGEISQKDIVIMASQRAKHIDQSQSLNLMIPSNAKPKEVSELYIEGWRMKIKGFYYQRSTSPTQSLVRSLLECKSCES